MLAVCTAVVDRLVGLDVSLGALYVFPVILAATVLKRSQIIAAAVPCAVLRVLFNPAASALEAALGFTMATLAYTGAGLFVAELLRNRQLVVMHMDQIRRQ